MGPENNFDNMLKKTLKEHAEPVSDEFAQQLLAKVQKIERQKILKKVILQERLALTGFILLPIAAIATAFFFPAVITAPAQQLTKLYPFIIQLGKGIAEHWQLYLYQMIAAAIAVYAVYESLLTDN